MGKFYLDIEFMNGNYNLTDIIEMALIAEVSGNAFHSYIWIHYLIPKQVKELTNTLVVAIGCGFNDSMTALMECMPNEQLQSATDPIIITHGGYSHDFSILLANCMKYNFNDFGILKDCLFIDSVHILKYDGYQRPGLDALCEGLNIKRHTYSLEDAYILKKVFIKKPELLDHPYGYMFKDIVSHLNGKLPIPIQMVLYLALKCSSYAELESIFFEYVNRKTALDMNQLCKIA